MVNLTAQTKTCRKCGKTLPLSRFHRQPKGLFGVKGTCAECLTAPKRKKWKHCPTGYKECITCGKVLPYRKFVASRYRADGYTSRCKKCYTVFSNRQKNPYTGRMTGIMDGWTEWHPLPYDVIAKMCDAEHRIYCEAMKVGS